MKSSLGEYLFFCLSGYVDGSPDNRSKESLPIFGVIGTGVSPTRPTRENFINVGVNCSPTALPFMLDFLYAREKVVF